MTINSIVPKPMTKDQLNYKLVNELDTKLTDREKDIAYVSYLLGRIEVLNQINPELLRVSTLLNHLASLEKNEQTGN